MPEQGNNYSVNSRRYFIVDIVYDVARGKVMDDVARTPTTDHREVGFMFNGG